MGIIVRIASLKIIEKHLVYVIYCAECKSQRALHLLELNLDRLVKKQVTLEAGKAESPLPLPEIE